MLNIIVIIISIAIAIIANGLNRTEMRCLELHNGCGWGGTPSVDIVVPPLPTGGESNKTLFTNIRTLLTLQSKMVSWRDAYILSVIISLLLWGLIIRKMPVWNDYLATLLVVFTPIYFLLNYNYFHWTDRLQMDITKSLDILENRI